MLRAAMVLRDVLMGQCSADFNLFTTCADIREGVELMGGKSSFVWCRRNWAMYFKVENHFLPSMCYHIAGQVSNAAVLAAVPCWEARGGVGGCACAYGGKLGFCQISVKRS